MKIILFLLVIAEIIFCQDKVYNNPDLGISFNYSESDYSPFTVYDTLTRNFSNNWNNFISKVIGISFKYPLEVSVLEDIMDDYYGESLMTLQFMLDTRIQKSNRNFVQFHNHLQVK